jgi:gluconate 2-dehydrogenase gamma chain
MTKNNSGEVESSGRRKALKKMAMGAGVAAAFPILGQQQALPATMAGKSGAMSMQAAPAEAAAQWRPLFFDAHQNTTLISLTDLIIPATDTPGAKEAQVNRVIDLFLNEEESDTQQEFMEGLAWIDGRALMQHSKPFVELSTAEQMALLEPLSDPANQNPQDRRGVKFFQELKDWTLFGYYTSQIGMEQELRYQGDQYNDSFPGACTHPEHQS